MFTFTNLQSQSPKCDVNIVISNLKNTDGNVGIFIFNKDDGFPMEGEEAQKVIFVKPSSTNFEYTIKGLDKGIYALTVFHDENSDKKIETNFIGMPKEGVAVSNGAKGRFGPPKFEDAKMNFDSGEKTLTLKLKY